MQTVLANVLVSVRLIFMMVHSDQSTIICVCVTVDVRATGGVTVSLLGEDLHMVVQSVNMVQAEPTPLPEFGDTTRFIEASKNLVLPVFCQGWCCPASCVHSITSVVGFQKKRH